MRFTLGSLIVLVVFLAGALWFQVRQRQNSEVLLRGVLAQRTAETKSTAGGNEDLLLSARVERLTQENRRLREKTLAFSDRTADPTGVKAAILKDALARLPEQAIPELQLATDADWYLAADGPLETVEDFRIAFSVLRTSVEKKFAAKAHRALAAYLRKNNGAFPEDPRQLAASFDGQIDESILGRYKIAPASEYPRSRLGGAWVITQRQLVDSAYDSRSLVGPYGFGHHSPR